MYKNRFCTSQICVPLKYAINVNKSKIKTVLGLCNKVTIGSIIGRDPQCRQLPSYSRELKGECLSHGNLHNCGYSNWAIDFSFRVISEVYS